jgi:hypothetical protein
MQRAGRAWREATTVVGNHSLPSATEDTESTE